MYFFFIGCKDELLFTDNSEEILSDDDLLTRAAFDGYFDWDRIDEITTTNPNNNLEYIIPLPWEKGSSISVGIPSEWTDENATSPTYSERMYSRENNWNLVYSNMHRNTTTKYFALYNEHTGILRFFFYEISTAPGTGTSESFWGLRVDRASSLLNFMPAFAIGGGKINYPSYVSTPPGAIYSDQFIGVGYKANNWYGLEIECAYDPSITANSGHNFEFRGWAANKINISGNIVTTGSINGTLEMFTNASSFNVSLNNMFNDASKNILNTGSDGVIQELGETVQEGVNKNDKFFKGLWNNIKSKAVSGIGEGVKEGFKAILSSGGSVAAKAIGSAVNSFLGINKSQPSIGKIDLSLNASSKVELVGETSLVGWGSVISFPIPGSTNNPNNLPIYNRPLGVWNLRATPTVIVETDIEMNEWVDVERYEYTYTLNSSSIILNPIIEQQFRLENVDYRMVVAEDILTNKLDVTNGVPYAYINGVKYWFIGNSASTGWWNGTASYQKGKIDGRCKLLVSFDLVSKTNPELKYSHSKYFDLEMEEGRTRIEYIDVPTDI